jgi:hypothetical protein
MEKRHDTHGRVTCLLIASELFTNILTNSYKKSVTSIRDDV